MTNTIRNDAKFRQVLPYEEMKPIFGRGIYPQDIDGEVEKSGNFLWFEWKSAPEAFTGGQWLASFKRIWLMGNRATMIVVYHSSGNAPAVLTDHVYGYQLIRRDRWLQTHADAIRVSKVSPGSWGRLKGVLAEWSKMADGKPNSFVINTRSLGVFGEYHIDLGQRSL